MDRNKPPQNSTVTMITFGADEESRPLEDEFGGFLTGPKGRGKFA
jgi:hypothetical protein